VGRRPFARADADRFFGRRAEAEAVRDLWLANRLVILHGASAVGKSSLLAAGVVPLIEEADPGPEVLPVAELASSAVEPPDPAVDRNISSYSVLRAWTQCDGPSIPDATFSDFLRDRQGRAGTPSNPRRILASIDHFDRIFDAPQYERDAFIGELANALRDSPEMNLLVVVGDGSMEKFELYQNRLWELSASYFRLVALTSAGALDAIRQPLASTDVTFQPAAAEGLLAQLGAMTAQGDASADDVHSWVEPLILQVTCAQLWSELSPREKLITADLIREVGDIGHVLRKFYESVIDDVHLNTRRPKDTLRGWIESAFIAEDGTPRSVGRMAGLFAGMPYKVVYSLADRNFLAIEHLAQRTSSRLALPALAPAVMTANGARRSESGPEALDYQPEVMPPNMIAAAGDALSEGNLSTAQSLADLVAERYRQSGDERQLAHALILLGDIAMARGDLDSAEENFQAALSRFSVLEDRNLTARMLSVLGEIRAVEGDYRRAEQFQQLAVDYVPTDVQALTGLGYAQWYGGSPANAEATFTQALDWDAGAVLAICGRGQVRAELREYGSALADLDEALSADLAPTEEADVRSARALALAGLGRAGEAERELASVRQVPRARTLLRSARVAMMSGADDMAIAELQGALAATPALSPTEGAIARRMLERLSNTAKQG
jgi:tetratricopeptide (TPR) repeat protein